jgi:ABC-2 type transport system ATP-binding protein
MNDLLLNAENLHKSYAQTHALQGVSLQLRAGEMVALLGPNGAGKSTLLQLLTGLFSPDQGRIEVLGHDLRLNASRALAGLGVVFQQSALDLDLSVRANLLFHTDLHGLPRAVARTRIDEGLALMGLTEQVDAVTRGLSGGTRRKVELVRALLQQLLTTVRQLTAQRQVGVLWATHLIEEIKVADRLLLLHRGQVRFDGSIDAFMAQAEGDDLHEEVLKQLKG